MWRGREGGKEEGEERRGDCLYILNRFSYEIKIGVCGGDGKGRGREGMGGGRKGGREGGRYVHVHRYGGGKKGYIYVYIRR